MLRNREEIQATKTYIIFLGYFKALGISEIAVIDRKPLQWIQAEGPCCFSSVY